MTSYYIALRAKYGVQNELYKVRYKIEPFEEAKKKEVNLAKKINREIVRAFYDKEYGLVLKKVWEAYTFLEGLV
ncbi:MAG: hypothetical protein WC157_00395 [Candidatus Paceibacterota bacterium]